MSDQKASNLQKLIPAPTNFLFFGNPDCPGVTLENWSVEQKLKAPAIVFCKSINVKIIK